MKILLGSVVLAALALGSPAIAEGALDPAGTWLTEDGRAKIKTEHCGEGSQKLCAYVVWMKNPLDENGQPRVDINNPDPAKRNRPSLGLELMSGLKPDDPTHYTGEIYNAENGKMYNVTLSIDSPAELKVHGCLLHFLCGSQSWERVADIAIPPTKVVSTAPTTKPKPSGGMSKHDVAPSAAK